jgi:hydroxyacylglutathione hydrolase
VFIASFPAGPLQANCYVAADAPGTECVIIDPGMDAIDGVAELIMEHRLKPVAVMLTHGHLDHMFSVTPLCRSYESVCWVHRADRALLSDPYRAMSAETRAMFVQLAGGRQFTEPDEVRELMDGAQVPVAGLDFRILHAPGHTPGSVMFETGYESEPGELRAGVDIDAVLFSGDVLFAGSIGRTDLPGGSHPDMLRSLRTKVLPLPDSVAVLPGHGPQTTMARERVSNLYLQERNLGEGDLAAPS